MWVTLVTQNPLNLQIKYNIIHSYGIFFENLTLLIWIGEIPLIISYKYTTDYNQRIYANESVKFNWFISVYTLIVISDILIAELRFREYQQSSFHQHKFNVRDYVQKSLLQVQNSTMILVPNTRNTIYILILIMKNSDLSSKMALLFFKVFSFMIYTFLHAFQPCVLAFYHPAWDISKTWFCQIMWDPTRINLFHG